MAARYIMRGATAESTVVALQTLMDRSTAPQDARWHARYDAIPSTVASAVKYGGRKMAEEEAATAALDAAAHDEALHAKIMAEQLENSADKPQHHNGAQPKANEAVVSFILGRASGDAETEYAPTEEAQAHVEPSTAPVDLWNTFAAPLLPIGLLPKLIEDFAFEQGVQMGADPQASHCPPWRYVPQHS